MRRLIAAVALLLAVPAASPGGTSEDPEIVDPAGDAVWVTPEGRTNADWADLTAAWYESVRDRGGTLTGFRVHITTVKDANAPDEDAFLVASWTVADSECDADVRAWLTEKGERTEIGPVWTEWPDPSAQLFYSCRGEGEPFSLDLPLRIKLWRTTRPAGLAVAGAEAIVTVSLGAFDEGRSKGLYREGTVLSELWATGGVLTPLFGISVDGASGGERTFRLGS